MFPDFDPACVEQRTLWTARYAQPIVHVGYRRDIPSIASPISNFFLCTMAQIYPNDRQVSNGVATGRKTAQSEMQVSRLRAFPVLSLIYQWRGGPVNESQCHTWR